MLPPTYFQRMLNHSFHRTVIKQLFRHYLSSPQSRSEPHRCLSKSLRLWRPSSLLIVHPPPCPVSTPLCLQVRLLVYVSGSSVFSADTRPLTSISQTDFASHTNPFHPRLSPPLHYQSNTLGRAEKFPRLDILSYYLGLNVKFFWRAGHVTECGH